jgi:putative hydrolase of the HAD superfamily
MIGDNLEADIYGAKNVGMKTIFFNPENQIVPDGIKSVSDLLEIKKML